VKERKGEGGGEREREREREVGRKKESGIEKGWGVKRWGGCNTEHLSDNFNIGPRLETGRRV